MKAINIADLSVVSDDVVLLRPISLSIEEGETLVVRGKNGTGKSTFLRVLAGAQHPSTGSAELFGAPASGRDPALRRKVSAMIGLPPMARDLTVQDHIRLVAATWFGEPVKVASMTHDLLESFEIDLLATRFPHELSSGQTQLFGLCLVLARPFDLLILDEPEQRLDAERVSLVCNVLRDLSRQHKTLAIATHNRDLASAVGDVSVELTGVA